MKIAIVDNSYPLGNKGKGVASYWIKWKLEKNGIHEASITDADIFLVSVTDPRDLKTLKNIRKKFPSKKIICGGPGALSPYSISKYCDCVVIGNGDVFLDTLLLSFDAACALSECYIYNETRYVIPRDGFPWDLPAVEWEDGSYRVVCGRGCKRKCKFCQTGWGVRYEEHPSASELVLKINNLLRCGKKVSYLSNDPSQHTFYNLLPAIGHGSFTLSALRKTGIPIAKQIRLGVEGVSSRLRSLIGKPISSSDLIKCTSWLMANHKQVRWFMIAGLPGETDDDWKEIRESIQEWKMITPVGRLELSFTAWQPEPATPWAVMPLDDEYQRRVEEFRHWFFDGPGWSNRVKIYFPAQPESRNKSAVARMGLPLEVLRNGGNLGPNQRVKYPYWEQRDRIIAGLN